MSNSNFLRKNINQHTIKNLQSSKMDKDIDIAIFKVIELLAARYPELTFEHATSMKISEIINGIETEFPAYKELLGAGQKASFIKPDGGFVRATDASGRQKIVLISEVKRQGTNDKRALEGKPKQAQGNAIERLGKNLIGIRAIFKNETVVPFVCFGQGHDFSEGSSILDRVLTMNEFFPLNTTFVHKSYAPFEPVSMYFRYEDWSIDEMVTILFDVAVQSVDAIFES